MMVQVLLLARGQVKYFVAYQFLGHQEDRLIIEVQYDLKLTTDSRG